MDVIAIYDLTIAKFFLNLYADNNKQKWNHSLQRGVHRRVLSNTLFDSIPRKKFPPKKLTSKGR